MMLLGLEATIHMLLFAFVKCTVFVSGLALVCLLALGSWMQAIAAGPGVLMLIVFFVVSSRSRRRRLRAEGLE